MNRELSFLSRLVLGKQATIEGSSPEKESRLDSLRSRGGTQTPRSGSTPRSPTPTSTRPETPRQVRPRSTPSLTPVLTQDTDIENYEEYIELERLEGNPNAGKRLREGRRYDWQYARKLVIESD